MSGIYILPTNGKYRVSYCDDIGKLSGFDELLDNLYEVMFFCNSPVFSNIEDAKKYANDLLNHYDCDVDVLVERSYDFPNLSFEEAEIQLNFFTE